MHSGNHALVKILYSKSLKESEVVRACRHREGLALAPLEDLAAWSESSPGLPCLLLLAPGEEIPQPQPAASLVCIIGGAQGSTSGLPSGWRHLPDPATYKDLIGIIREEWPFLPMAMSLSKLRHEFDVQALILDQLTEVSMALSTERDHRRLLDLILSRAILLSGSDAGSLYLLLPPDEFRPPRLLFAATQNNSVTVPFKLTELPVSTASLAGYVATTGETLHIEDAYSIPETAPYRLNRAFDIATGYRTKSQLVLPMTNHKGDITGVLQLINKKKDPSVPLQTLGDVASQVVSFDQPTTRLMKAVGSLAAVAIDNNRLYENIERLFEGFVKASVTAIEQRDPTTSGHSLRVSILTVDLADKLTRIETGPLAGHRFSEDQFRELRYAAILHDFGKVGVREQVLVKAKKLYPYELERVMTRLEMARLYREREILMQKVGVLAEAGPSARSEAEELDAQLERGLQDLDRIRDVILRSDEPTVLPEGDFSALQEVLRRTFMDRHGQAHSLLEPEEVAVLSIRKGSLSEEERLQIESHVTHTYNFLRQIPWTPELRNVPDIAYGHHEKLNGRGYPRGITEELIPIQSKVMTVSDIFDALSAADRPYKKAVPVQRALDILQLEAGDGLLDKSLVAL
jgi:HD-GYP domain-containing protein (c-di-GMP phosphodiesterase class II)